MNTSLEDNYRHKGLRKQLVELLRTKGITDEAVLSAINEVPRHIFLDSSFVELAYQDKAFPIGSGQTISQPHTVAFQTQLLQVKKGMKVLEIGTGSGYQACVLAAMGAKVFSIERQRNLFFKTKEILEQLSFRVKTFLGDGYHGQRRGRWPNHAEGDQNGRWFIEKRGIRRLQVCADAERDWK